MDDEGLPALVPLANRERTHGLEYVSTGEDPIPALIPIVERRSFLVPSPAHEDSDVDDMPNLMSVSDSSDDADVSSFYYSSEEDAESEWGELDEDFNENLPPLPPSHEDTTESDEEEEEDVRSPEYTARFSRIFPFLSDNSWFPHRRLRARGRGLIPEALLEVIALRMDSLIPEESVAPPVPDLDRAKVLVDGLERVSGGLLERMLRVGGAPGAYEDVSKEDKSVSGCAICCETLLDQNILVAESTNDILPFAPENNNEVEIVCLPCAHVFHSSCLIPWFSQKTSCPTCRFNIDPDSLSQRSLQLAGDQDNNPQPTTSTHSASIQREVRYDIYDVEDAIEDVLSLDDQPSESDVTDGSLFELWAEPDHNHFTSGVPSQSFHANRSWTRPDAPGKSLRESIEEKEREMGLRCMDPLCMFAPTDDAPRAGTTSILRQISIKVVTMTTCIHAVHPACLVRSARVAGWKAVTSNAIDVYDSGFSAAEVLCPSCLTTGTVSRKDWEEGAIALAKDDT